MEHYVTLFDSFFLPQGLALHMSMERHAVPYRLWILCVDDQVFHVLNALKLANVKLMRLSELETDELRRVKENRTVGEYCWTLTPFAPRFVFEADSSVSRVTYLDADMWFRKNPKPIFHEFEQSGKCVLITDHAYAPEYDQSATSGQFCVQFVTFCRETGERVRSWWEARCIEWCYSRLEAGKFGDQKYLDDWPERFSDEVHILQQQQFMLAPWNVTRFPYGSSILFHFHGLRIGNKIYVVDFYHLPNVVVKNIYEKYIYDIQVSIKTLSNNGFVYVKQAGRFSFVSHFKYIIRSIRNIFESSFNKRSFKITI